jgi:excisionase family DNA binding protein
VQEEERLSLREAADALGVSEVTARRWVKSGKLRAYQPGRKYLIPRGAIDELLESESGKVQAPSSQEKLFNNGVLEEEQRAAWEAAVDNARRLREGSRARLEELIAKWQASRARGELRSARRGYAEEIEGIFNNAYGARVALTDILFPGPFPPEEDWDEVRAADSFYRTLIEVMKDAGFDIQERESGPPEIRELAG